MGRRAEIGVRARWLRGTLVVGLLLATIGGARQSVAQGRLTGVRTTAVAPTFESWRFSDPVPQLGMDGTDVSVARASQWSVPLFAAIPLGERWTFDLSTAYASGSVSLEGRDGTGRGEYRLSGLADSKLRLTGRVVGDNVLLTFGLNAPTGRTQLDDEEYAALRVLSAPALAFATPALGSGAAGTAGVVLARQAAGWAWALGASYEFRGRFDPLVLTVAPRSGRFSPGDGIHLSVGGDGLVGQHGMTFGATADFFTSDRFRIEGEPDAPVRRLGPIYAAHWQLRVAAPRVREFTLYAADRYRSKFRDGGRPLAGTDGNYLDAGIRVVWGAPGRIGVLTALDAHHHTGLDIDDAMTTAASAGGGATIGLLVSDGGRFAVRPFVRGMLGRLDVGGHETSVSGFAAGVSFGTSY